MFMPARKNQNDSKNPTRRIREMTFCFMAHIRPELVIGSNHDNIEEPISDRRTSTLSEINRARRNVPVFKSGEFQLSEHFWYADSAVFSLPCRVSSNDTPLFTPAE
jgi:hypothetical protein